MALVNSITMSGYVATDPQVFGKDRNVGKFRIRWDKRKKVGEKWESEGHFFSVTIFGGENVERLLDLKKGDKVVVSGKLSQNRKEETKQEFIDIIADEFAFVPTEPKAQPPGRSSTPSREAQDFLDVS